MRAGQYKGWLPTLFVGQLLQGQTVGIVGAGRIGAAYARMVRRARFCAVSRLCISGATAEREPRLLVLRLSGVSRHPTHGSDALPHPAAAVIRWLRVTR
jgi:hypothetical protein